MLTLSKELKPGSRATVERVLQGNSFFAHHENILIGMLRDEDEEVRRQAVLYIRQRNKLNFEFHIEMLPSKFHFSLLKIFL